MEDPKLEESRHITLLTQVCIVKVMVFPVVIYGCESWIIKKAECPRLDAFKLWCWRRLLESPLDIKEIKPVNPKEINLEYSLEGLMLKPKLQHFGHLMQRADSLEKTLMLEKTEGRTGGEGGNRGWDGIIGCHHWLCWMASLTQWTWVWTTGR